MSSSVVVIPGSDTDFVELSSTGKGRIFRKQILHMNEEFMYPGVPGNKIKVDENLALSLVKNFKDKICSIVQVPIVDDENKHSEDPLRNIGEVIDVEYDDKGVYAVFDARNSNAADALGKTLLGASAMLSLNYLDTRTGGRVGPTLLHMAITNRPYLTNLGGFEEVVSLSADSNDEEPPVLLTPFDKENAAEVGSETQEDKVAERDEVLDGLTQEELYQLLFEKFGVDVEALQAAAEAPGDDEPVIDGPVDEEVPTVTDEIVEETPAEEPVVDEVPADDEVPVVDEPVADEVPVVDEPAADEDEDDEDEDEIKPVDLSNALKDLGIVSLSGSDELTLSEIGEAIVVLSDRLNVAEKAVKDAEAVVESKDAEIVTLSSRVAEIEEERLVAEIDTLVSEGRIIPVKRDAMLELARTNRELFDDILPSDAIVSLTETGVTVHDEPESSADDVKRLAEKAKTL